MFKFNSKRKDIDEIGTVLFERSHRARYVNISIRQGGNVRVAVPYGVSFGKAEKILVSRADWVRRHQSKQLKTERVQRDSLEGVSAVNPEEAKAKILERLEILARLNGFRYNRVFIRNQKTRWGSCSSRNNINLNVKLIFLPEFLMDYVILHELVHLEIKNHGKTFWARLNQYVGNAKSVDKQLKRYSLGIIGEKMNE